MRKQIDRRALQIAIVRFTDVVETQIAEAVELLSGEEQTARLCEIADALEAQLDKIRRVWLPIITDEIGRAERQTRRMQHNRSSFSARGPLEEI